MTATPYDEFGMLAENAAEAGLDVPLPRGERVSTGLPDGTAVSAIRWGDGDPHVVLLHGGGQNAHTWDTVVLALGVPALAIDLPGHGHSDWRADRDYWPVRNADAVAAVLTEHAPGARAVVGMSLGGLTAIRLGAAHPRHVARMVVVDVTPSVMQRQSAMTERQRGTTALTAGPRVFPDLDAMVSATAAHAPHRPLSNVRRGVLHNSRQRPDGGWEWRYDELSAAATPDFTTLWADLAASSAAVALVVGGDSAFVGDADVEEFRRRRPGVVVESIAGAGHSVQSDQPAALASFLRGFLKLPA
jgi:esterase